MSPFLVEQNREHKRAVECTLQSSAYHRHAETMPTLLYMSQRAIMHARHDELADQPPEVRCDRHSGLPAVQAILPSDTSPPHEAGGTP